MTREDVAVLIVAGIIIAVGAWFAVSVAILIGSEVAL